MISGRFKECFVLFLLTPVVGFGQMNFTEITLDAGIDHHYLGVNEMGGGAAFFDMDNDGDDDLWISGGLNKDVLYENDGKGNFTDISQSAGLFFTKNVVTTGVITGDLDNNGFRDVYLITHRGFSNMVVRNNGDKTFTNVTNNSGIDDYRAYSLAAAMGDINRDGFIDIYAAHYIEKDQLQYNQTGDTVIGFAHQGHPNKMYINNGDWTFTEVGSQYGVDHAGCALATTFSDFDDDGDPDILVANDFGAWIKPNVLFENQYPKIGFNDVSESSGMDVGIYGMGIAVGDYDQDLDLDYYITNLGRNVLMQNQGDGSFIDLTQEAGISDKYAIDSLLTVGWGTAFMDFDNDTDLDLFVVNGWIPAAPFIHNSVQNPNRLFENTGNGAFKEMEIDSSLGSSLRGRGYACSDIDLDGDLDFLVINVNRQATSGAIHPVQLYRNDLINENNWIQIKLQGAVNNLDGLGSKIVLSAGGNKYLGECNGGYGTHASQHSSTLHFGLKDATVVDSVEIRWPGGNRQVLINIPINQTHTFTESGTVQNKILFESDHLLKCSPNPFNNKVIIELLISQTGSQKLRIFNALGSEIYHFTFLGVKDQNWLHQWTAPETGYYFLVIENDRYIINKKLISK